MAKTEEQKQQEKMQKKGAAEIAGQVASDLLNEFASANNGSTLRAGIAKKFPNLEPSQLADAVGQFKLLAYKMARPKV